MFFLTKLEQFIQDLAITTLFSFLEFSINMDHTKILNIGCFSNRCKKNTICDEASQSSSHIP